ncbi:MAG TPA: GPW/gp25 family protein [Polyangiales bacterium]|nr:GPW/gp25 family protein [Polyangiales bacterium]
MDIDFPHQLDGRARTALARTDEHVRDMIEQLIFTNPGERVNRPDFGSGLLQLVFAPNSPELAATVQFTLQAALQRWLRDVIEVKELRVTAAESTLRIDLSYLLQGQDELRTASFSREV